MSSDDVRSRNSWVDELSEAEKQKMIEEVKSLRKEYDSLMADTEEGFFNYLRTLAGPYADVLIRDRNETLKSISSDVATVREVALRLAESHWNMEDEVADQCEVLAQTDPSESVRYVALGILGLSYRNTQEVRIGRLLAAAVKNDEYSARTRLHAYASLVTLDGKHNHPGSLLTLSMASINWSLVEKYLSATQ